MCLIFIAYIISNDSPLTEVTWPLQGHVLKRVVRIRPKIYNIITLHAHNKNYILLTLLHVTVESGGVRYNRWPNSPAVELAIHLCVCPPPPLPFTSGKCEWS